MKRIFLVLAILIPFIASAQKPFELRKDNVQSVIEKLSNYKCSVLSSVIDDKYIVGIIVNDYNYKGKEGTLALLLGDDRLYAVKFVPYRGIKKIWVDDKLWEDYKDYWEL